MTKVRLTLINILSINSHPSLVSYTQNSKRTLEQGCSQNTVLGSHRSLGAVAAVIALIRRTDYLKSMGDVPEILAEGDHAIDDAAAYQ